MKKIMVTGALGQIGSELIAKLRSEYGTDNVLATDIRRADSTGAGPFEILDVTNADKMHALAKDFGADTMMHMAALLSAKAESEPLFAWNLNMGGLINAWKCPVNWNCNFLLRVRLVHLVLRRLKMTPPRYASASDNDVWSQ